MAFAKLDWGIHFCGGWYRYDERTYNTLLQGWKWDCDMSVLEGEEQAVKKHLLPIISHYSPITPYESPIIAHCSRTLPHCSPFFSIISHHSLLLSPRFHPAVFSTVALL